MSLEAQKRKLQHKLSLLGVTSKRVLLAVDRVPRELFVPTRLLPAAYVDTPLPIGEEQTISQPSLVAFMTQKLGVSKSHRVLEIGTGSGYQTAILAELAREVFTLEVRATLSQTARETLAPLGYDNIHYRVGDGTAGWPEAAPFDRIMVTAAGDKMPEALLAQLKVGGRMVLPLATDHRQELFLVTKTKRAPEIESLLAVRFVPIVSEDPKNLIQR